MSIPWLLGGQNGRFETDTRDEGEDKPLPVESRDRTGDSSAIWQNAEGPVDVGKLAGRQDYVQWNERGQTYDGTFGTLNPENVIAEGGMYDRDNTMPACVLNGTGEEGRLSSEWVMSAGEYGQVLLEIPKNRADNLNADCAQLDSNREKAELGEFLEGGARNGNSVFHICNPSQHQGVIGVGLESLPNTVMTSHDSSGDMPITGNSGQPKLKLADTNLFRLIQIVPQKHSLGINVNGKNILEQLSDPKSVGYQTLPSTTMNNEASDSSTLNLQNATFENLLTVTNASASNQCFPEECFSVANFENVMDLRASLGTDRHACHVTDVPTVNYRSDGLPLCQPSSCKLNKEASLSFGECALKPERHLSVMDLVLETSVLSKHGYEGEVEMQVLTSGAEEASTLKNCFTTACINVVTPPPDVGFSEPDQSEIQKPLQASVLSLVINGNLSVPTTANESAEMQSKHLNIDKQSRSSSKSSVTFLDYRADSATKKKVVALKVAAVSQQSTIVPNVDRHESEGVICDQTEARKFVCSQEDCGWSFPTAYKLRRHEETHEGRKDFMCSIDGCNKKFTTIYNLKTHLKLHKLPCTEVCPQPNCTQTFRNKRLLDKHLKLHSNGEKTYKCPHPGCTKTFFSQTSIGSHARVHQHDSELTCAFDGCGRKFDKLCRLKQHMRCHTGERPYRCTVEGCNWAFSTSSRLCRHLQMHNGQKKWSCPFDGCNKLFTRAEHVRGHLVTHSSQRPFICMSKGCDARFKSKNSLDIHLKRHCQMDKKPKGVVFYCPHEDCSHKFSTKAQLRAHIDSHENLSTTNSCQAPVSKDFSLLSSAAAACSSNIVTSVDHSLFLGAEQSVEGSSANHMTTTALNLLTLPVLVASEPSAICSVTSSATFVSRAARTDFPSYHLVNQRAVLKWQDPNCDSLDTGLLNSGHLKDMASSSEPLHCLPEQMTPGVMLNADEIMTSHAITFRDPETGTIYVQTQLMQDDPPSTNIYLDDGGDSGSTNLRLEAPSRDPDQPPVLAAELSSMLHSGDDFNDEDSRDAAFTGTTINLQDLE